MWGEGIGIVACVVCREAIFEDEDGRLVYHALGSLILCSPDCVEEAKDTIRTGGTIFGV